ncbi:MAG: hypothetical protein EZS28_003413 [Streblomastix strix]|uniref:Uncharacterized protein n=1 Tax=Streblomastix strix TaxID=222440 RepID=A0A5J4X179_9EUKA|nr:MAG: hypothetical protein EZS28_003413 [Streblomastix strix]
MGLQDVNSFDRQCGILIYSNEKPASDHNSPQYLNVKSFCVANLQCHFEFMSCEMVNVALLFLALFHPETVQGIIGIRKVCWSGYAGIGGIIRLNTLLVTDYFCLSISTDSIVEKLGIGLIRSGIALAVQIIGMDIVMAVIRTFIIEDFSCRRG